MILRKMYSFLSSVKLAIVLLIVILGCCLTGVTIIREERAWNLIFSTLWFNSLLVLLVVNVACCFFPRIWTRKLTITTFGMILFHLSFVAILSGIAYNSLFYFRGIIRLTEGETLPNGDPKSYDHMDYGRFFNFSRLKGDTTLIKMHTGYKVDGKDKRVAYEIAVGEGSLKKHDIIYVTHSLVYRGFKYFNDKEGYAILMTLNDKSGKELYGAYIPLQSLKQKDESYLYTTGTKEGPAGLAFPPQPGNPLVILQFAYHPSKFVERKGEVFFQVWPFDKKNVGMYEKPLFAGKSAIGERFDIGENYLVAKEVRYWVGMDVRYEPGQPIVLASLWMGLIGMVITFIGRLRKGMVSIRESAYNPPSFNG